MNTHQTLTDQLLNIIDISRLENRVLNDAEYETILLILKGDFECSDNNYTYEELKSGGQND